MKRLTFLAVWLITVCAWADKQPIEYVDPFIGTSNFGTTNPGAVCPNGMMSVVPFNVMGSDLNEYDKDKRWWSAPYEKRNRYFTGYAHVNLSGVGCPELSSLLLMPTTGKLCVDYREYGSAYTDEAASPGYYTNMLSRYGIKTEVTAAMRSSVARFTFPKGESHVLLNLGEGLTNESGAMLRYVGNGEFEGMKLLGTFCYNPQAVFPIYFVMRVNKKPVSFGYWKKQRPMQGVEAEWDKDQNRYKLYLQYGKEIAGDDIGGYLTFKTEDGEAIEVRMAVSFVSIANARLNLQHELQGHSFDNIHEAARKTWSEHLSRILVEGGSEEQRKVFYTALYHTLIHPNILQDVNGEYPAMESDETLTTQGNRYTVYSLWDTYRNVHQLLTLVYPEKQIDMVRSMVEMYRESGWLPKWELYGRETLTMEGDPAIPVIVDTWEKGLRDFDIKTAYEAMYKSATTVGKINKLRPDIDDYHQMGYVPLREKYDNSVSHALEYYVADNALASLAKRLGKTADYELFYKRSLGYKHYYCKDFGVFRPRWPDGRFYSPFNPRQGENFEPVPGFHEGSAWNYTFYVPHDIVGLAKLMGGGRAFVDKLQKVFDEGLYDPANEPNIAYPYLFSYFKGEEWRTQRLTQSLLAKYFTSAPNGIPGNDDAGTMSAWAVFSMMGFYPDCPGNPSYTLTVPVFDKVTIKLDPQWYGQKTLVITRQTNSIQNSYLIEEMKVGQKRWNKYRISHDLLVNAGQLLFICK